MLKNKQIVLGVTGGIAAYKAATLIGLLRKHGANVHVVMTQNATQFITPLTLGSLSNNAVAVGMFDAPTTYNIEHISLAKRADLVVVAPASANLLGKVNAGIADDMLSTTIMATKAPVLFAPAMNNNMWENGVVQNNVKHLQAHGYHFVMPQLGVLACGDEAVGKLANTQTILQSIIALMQGEQK